MNEEIKSEVGSRILSYLDAVESSASSAGEFIAEQTPLVAQEYLAWCFWGAMLMFAFALFVIMFSVFLMRLAVKWYRDDCTMEAGFFVLIVAIGGMLLGSFMVALAAERAVKVSVAPRVVLLEKVAELSRGFSK